MIESAIKYKSHQRVVSVPPCSVDYEYLKRLFKVLEEASLKAAELDIAKLKKAPDQTDAEFEGLKQYSKGLYKVTIQVFGSKGEFIVSDSPTIFDDSSLPDSIDAIIFDNSIEFNFALKREPSNKVRVEFDFRRQPISNIFPNPSVATPNNSTIKVIGEDKMWVAGAYKNIIDMFEKKKNGRGWLHKNFVYDLFLWFLIFPLIFWTMFRIDTYLSSKNWLLSPVFVVALYIYLFLFVLYIFRLVFLSLRSAFPYVELITPQKSSSTAHRLAVIAIVLTIVFPIVWDVLKYFYALLTLK